MGLIIAMLVSGETKGRHDLVLSPQRTVYLRIKCISLLTLCLWSTKAGSHADKAVSCGTRYSDNDDS